MKITKVDDDRLVLTQFQWALRAFGVVLLAVAAVIALRTGGSEALRCDALSGDRACSLVEFNLVGGTLHTTRLPASEVRGVELVSEMDDDELTHCVVIVTDEKKHGVGRCSLKREAYLDELVRNLSAFYAGKSDSVKNDVSDVGFLWVPLAFLIFSGVAAVFGPSAWRVEFDRKRGVLSKRVWLPPLRREQIPLRRVREVVVVTGSDSEGDELLFLVARLDDDRQVHLSKGTRLSRFEKEREAVEAFLASTPAAYR